MNEKKIEPTDAMVEAGASSAWEEANPGILGWNSISERHKDGCRRDARAVLTAALNHPDADGLFADVDVRPWEPLNGPVRVGDEVRQERAGITITGVVARVDRDGDPRAADDVLIGLLHHGTWYVRRPATPPAVGVELPGEPCVLTDVQLREVLAAGVALWTGLEAVTTGFNGRAVAHSASDLTAFTLPDGTRSRRDGNHADGTPRFVKVESAQ